MYQVRNLTVLKFSVILLRNFLMKPNFDLLYKKEKQKIKNKTDGVFSGITQKEIKFFQKIAISLS